MKEFREDMITDYKQAMKIEKVQVYTTPGTPGFDKE